MNLKILLGAAMIAAPASLIAQQPAWQPAPGHVTMPLWPNGVARRSQSAARD
jgi:4'-phosphopantetheinyl transferase EntD